MKPLNLGSLVTKKTRRAKARFLQNFGKADRTTDELFEVYQLDFNRQQSATLNLQKHAKHYTHCLKELHDASKALSQCIMEMHDSEWPKHDVYENNAYELDHINEDLEEKLKESVLVPLEQYIGQFSIMREKLAKRGRKLVDYDDQRHTFEALKLQHQRGKQQDDVKLNKSRDRLEEAKRIYEALNSEVHDELHSLYDNRLPFIITVYQRLFSSKITYHNDNLAIQKSYLDTIEQLSKLIDQGGINSTANRYDRPLIKSSHTTAMTTDDSADRDKNDTSALRNTHPSNSNLSTGTTSTAVVVDGGRSEGTTSVKGPVYLHKVCATYKYMAEDEDEISFEAGETIQVIEYEDPDEQEEGWLMGIKESDGKRGLFPANFTKEV